MGFFRFLGDCVRDLMYVFEWRCYCCYYCSDGIAVRRGGMVCSKCHAAICQAEELGCLAVLAETRYG